MTVRHLFIPDVIWKSVEDYEGDYIVSNSGKVASLKATSFKILIPRNTHDGYARVTLSKGGKLKTYRVARLVAKAFVGGYETGLTVNHKDENKDNNSVDNLEWMSQLQLENSRYSQCMGWIVTLPDGKEIHVKNLHQFCKDNSLDQGTMYNVAKGKFSHHKKYKVRRSVND
jgi:hypothetical protein